MLGVDPRAFRITWTVFVFALTVAVIYQIRETLVLLAVAIFVAYMLAPLVNVVARVTPRRRGIALAIVYTALVGAIITLGASIGSQIVDEASMLFNQLPKLVSKMQNQNLPLPAWLEPMRFRILETLQQEAAQLQASLVPLLQKASGHILSGLGVVVLVILVPIISFFLLKDAPEINQGLVEVLRDRDQKHTFSQILDDIHELLSKYIRALVLLAGTSFAAWAIFLYLIRAPYPLLLAGISGALEFIPAVGPALALVIVVVVAAVSGYTSILIWLVIFWGIFRLFQDYVINPLLMSAGVQLHPILVLLGVIAGGQIGGVPGLFFSVPVIAILKVLFVRMRDAKVRARLSSHPPAIS